VIFDEATQRLLNRGSHLTELLKQPQYTPYSIEAQVVVVFAGVKGFFDKLDLNQVLPTEKALLDFVFNTVTFKPFIMLLREEFEEPIFHSIVSSFVK
jgi:F0F1-type ATP synthase alpha subunit